jgi:transposase
MVHRRYYSSDLNDREWQILEPLLPAEKPGGRHLGLSDARSHQRHSVCFAKRLRLAIDSTRFAALGNSLSLFPAVETRWNVGGNSRSFARRDQEKDGSGN